MSSYLRRAIVVVSLIGAAPLAQAPLGVPRIWDEAALANWATPIAALQIRPGHFSAEEYYSAPADNLRTYPVYRPDREPPGYWEELQKKKPEPLVDAAKMHAISDWIAAGERAFREIDNPLSRTDDPALITKARDPRTFDNVPGLADGTVREPRWMVTAGGVRLSNLNCASCHARVTADGTMEYVTPPGAAIGRASRGLAGAGAAFQLGQLAARRAYLDESAGAIARRMFDVPWGERDERLNRLFTASEAEIGRSVASGNGVFARINGSPFYGTRVPDLHLLRYSRYLDATGTHQLRGPEDVGRYGALISGADSMEFGTHRFLSDAQRRVRTRYADEVLYAIGVYLLSLEPPNNPNPPASALIARGQEVFVREKCARCHPPPAYTTGGIVPAVGTESVGTDPGLALKTRKGTGFYKIPSLRGLWYRPRLLHDASITSLEELFDAARLSPEYERTGWHPPGATKGPVPGLEFLTKLAAEDKTTLIAFLRSL